MEPILGRLRNTRLLGRFAGGRESRVSRGLAVSVDLGHMKIRFAGGKDGLGWGFSTSRAAIQRR